MKFDFKISCYIIIFCFYVVESSDITNLVFGKSTIGYKPAAFGDFNSDELTDVFMIFNEDRGIQVFIGSDTEPLLTEGAKCVYKHIKITSIVPGDFDGDAFMDIMFTAKTRDEKLNVYINWGSANNSDSISCTDENSPVIEGLNGEPLALDYNKDMIIDLFGLNYNNERVFYIFNKDRTKSPETIKMDMDDNFKYSKLKIPHSHAYLDVNNDFAADLFLVTEENFEVWNGTKSDGFMYNQTYHLPIGNFNLHVGQSLFLDFELKGHMNQIIPICFDSKCVNSSILVRSKNNFHDIHVNFKDMDSIQWGFIVPNSDEFYSNTITLRGGDFNMDGYPDILVTLSRKTGGEIIQTFLLENVPCERSCNNLSRTLVINWKALVPFTNGTVMGAFYDFYQDGVLDIIFVEKHKDNKYKTVAFRNTLDYDANFIKVIVLTGLKNKNNPQKLTPLGRHKKTYGTNLPGPRIEYTTTTQEGCPQHGANVQLPQSAYFSLHLPYNIFGLGRTPNFVDTLKVGISNYSKEFNQIIPNSQMIVVPWPIEEPSKWKAKLFVTPSKLIIMSVFALGATCLVIMLIILGLYIKEKREDKIQKLAEAHRFHFDAM